jgi:hypothetical protein
MYVCCKPKKLLELEYLNDFTLNTEIEKTIELKSSSVLVVQKITVAQSLQLIFVKVSISTFDELIILKDSRILCW